MTHKVPPQKQTPMELQEVLDRVGHEKEFLGQLIDLYRQEFSDKYSRLKQAVEKKEFASIQEIGHSLKGSSGNLSLKPLHHVSWRMEKAGKNKNLTQTRKLLSQLKEEFERWEKFLQNQDLK